MNRTELLSLLQVTLDRISKDKTISNESYAILITCFPIVIAPTLDILDNGKVTKIVCEKSRRSFYKVKESSGNRKSEQSNGTGYRGYLGTSGGISNTELECNESIFDVKDEFCFCYFYAKECLIENGSAVFCKHVLATKLAEALDIVQVKEIEEKDFAPLYL